MKCGRKGEMCCWGLVVRACRCGRDCLRGEVLGDGGGAGELTCRREEMRVVVEAASPM